MNASALYPLAPVAVFDSGVGGIGVLKEIQALLPAEDILYFGDSKMAPYGARTHDELCALISCHAARLLEKCKALVLACNTATAVAIDTLRAQHTGVPIIGMEPALRPALAVKQSPHVLVLATPTTLREARFRALLAANGQQARFSLCAAPRLVTLVESGLADSAEADRYLSHLLAPYTGQNKPDAVVLGCTHFPFARRAILRYFGNDMPLFDGAVGTARQLYRALHTAGLLNPRQARGSVQLTSSDPAALSLYAAMLQGAI